MCDVSPILSCVECDTGRCSISIDAGSEDHPYLSLQNETTVIYDRLAFASLITIHMLEHT